MMAVETPPGFLQSGGSYGAEQTRRSITYLLQRGANIGSVTGGIVGPSDCQVTAGSGMQVSTSSGEVIVPQTYAATGGGVYCRVSSATTSAVATSDPTNNRCDLLVAQVDDAAYSGALNDFKLSYLVGTPTAGSTLTNKLGAPSVPTSAYALAYVLVPAGSSSVTNGNILNVAAQIVPGVVEFLSGVDGAKPSVSTYKGYTYYATDSNARYYSDGTTWRTIYGSRGGVNITTYQTTGSATYTTLSTPDQVSGIILPSNGLLAIWYQATWTESVSGAARAAVFIGANQLKIAGSANNIVQEQGIGGTAPENVPLSTTPLGLGSPAGSTGYPGDVTTGQVLGSQLNGGPTYAFAAAGTYTVSVQFKISSGTVSAFNRRLYVQALPFS